MSTKNELKVAIAGFDGRANSILTEARARLGDRPDYDAALVSLAADKAEPVSSGATWLIKHELENGWAMPADAARVLAAALDGVTAWEAQLHLCQSARFIDLPADVLPAWQTWLHPLLTHDRPFLRVQICRTRHQQYGDRKRNNPDHVMFLHFAFGQC